MAVDGINSTNSTTSTERKSTKSNSTVDTGLNVTDFLSLIAAQLQNQDMMNPMKDTEFISQLAQFTQLQATQSLLETNTTAYAASLIGKEITAAAMTKAGDLETTSGIVTGVSLFEGKPIVYIDKKSFDLAQIMTVGKIVDIKDTTPDGSTTGGNGTTK